MIILSDILFKKLGVNMNIAKFLSSFGKGNNKHSVDFISRKFKRYCTFLVPVYDWFKIKSKVKKICTGNALFSIVLAISSSFFTDSFRDLFPIPQVDSSKYTFNLVTLIISSFVISVMIVCQIFFNKAVASSKEDIIADMTSIEERQDFFFRQTTDFPAKITAYSTHTVSSTKNIFVIA